MPYRSFDPVLSIHRNRYDYGALECEKSQQPCKQVEITGYEIRDIHPALSKRLLDDLPFPI